VFRRSDGSTFTSTRESPMLSEDAVPTLFPNTLSYLSAAPPAKRRNPDDRRGEVADRDEQLFQNWLDQDIILDYMSFQSKLSSEAVELGKDWIYVNKGTTDEYVLFVNIVDLPSSCCPTIFASFKVLSNMTVQIFDSIITVNIIIKRCLSSLFKQSLHIIIFV